MVDNAEITVSGKDDIRIKDYLGYIQDDIDLSSLMGLWNFAGSVRDESGNQLNEENAYNNFAIKGGLTYPAQTSSSRVLGKRSMQFNSGTSSSNTGRFLKIPDKKTKNANGTDSTYSIVDWSNDFTLAFYVKLFALSGTSTSDPVNGVLFDKYDDSTNKGIMVYTQTPQGSASTVRNLKIRIGNGSTNTIYTHTMSSSDWTNLDKHICVTRTNGVVKIYVENTEVLSVPFTGDVTSTADIYIGKEYSETASALVEPSSTGRYGAMQATYHQMRIYSRAWSTTEITKWVGLNAPSISLKFYGRIWRIDERNASNKCYLKGLGSVALNSRIDSSLLTLDVANLRDLNIYKAGTDYTDIIQDMLTKINEKFFGTSNSDILMINYLHDQKAVGEGYTLKAPFVAEGTFLDIINDLSVLDESTFTFMPTGILQIEENDSLLTRGGLILSNNNCKINDGGIDDSNICNHLFACARLDEFESTDSRSIYQNSGDWYTTLFLPSGLSTAVFPISIISVKESGSDLPVTNISPDSSSSPSVNCYFVDKQKSKISFYKIGSGATVNYTWEYTYNLNCANIPDPAKSRSVSKIFPTGSTQAGWNSIIKNGLYARKISVPRLTPALESNDQDINDFTINFVTANKGDSNDNIQNRYEVKTPSFIGHLLENNKIGIYYIKKGIGSVVSGNIQPVYLQIKSIEYRFPDSQTKLEIGNFLYDSFDLETSLVEDVRSTQSNQF